ncbi:MAG: glycosyltransferase family 4 protein [Marmoricola sp.]
MRILHLTDHYAPVLGGIEAHVESLARHQAARGDEVTVLTSAPAEAEGRRSDDSGPVRVVRVPSAFEVTGFDFASYDVAHVHLSVFGKFSCPAAGLAVQRGVPTIVTVHSLWKGWGPLAGPAAGVCGLRRARVQWTAVSEVAAEQLLPHLPRGRRVVVLPNAADVPPASHRPDPDGPVRLVSTMRIARRKRPLHLLDIFARVHRSATVPTELFVIGDGPWRDRFERRAARLGLADHVEVTGRLEPDDVLRGLARSHVYVAPATLESFGLAALEARCVGLPVVGHAASGIGEFVRDGTSGFLCEDDAALADRVRQLVDDRVLRERMSRHNRTTPSRRTWAASLERHEHLYDEMAGSVPAGAAADAPLRLSVR